jgi:ArsR family transcriptional regulator
MSEQTPQPTRIGSLRALADPVRLALIDELVCEDACACELRKKLDLSAPLLSHHLKVLREAGLVSCVKVGRRVEVTLNRGALAQLAGSLAA